MESKGPLVLGVSALYHDSAAALVRGDKIIAAAQEERFTRVKGDDALPVNSMAYVLAEARITPTDLDAVAFYEVPHAKLERLVTSYPAFGKRSISTFSKGFSNWTATKFDVRSLLRHELGIKKTPVYFLDHHLSHAASAFYPSPFHEAAVLTIDGVGEWATTTISKGSGASLLPLKQIEYPDSIGLLYSAFTAFCGFKVNSGEYKLMGLAPYGTPRFSQLILDEILTVENDGSYRMNPAYFDYVHGDRSFSEEFENLFRTQPRKPESDLTQVHADLAASIQEVTNLVVIALARQAKELTGSQSLVLAGGVALNVVAMGKLESSKLFERIWIQPAAGDAGGALGAALQVSHSEFGATRKASAQDSMQGSFLGPQPRDFSPSPERALENQGLVSVEMSVIALANQVARRLSEGKIVAVARGRMEYGPRALGSRSILAPATDPEMQSKLNLRIKFRESFRPFAPMVLEEDFFRYFISDQAVISPYMLKTYYVRNEIRRQGTNPDQEFGISRINQIRSAIPAVTHLDFSARVQTIDSSRNPFIYRVIRRYKEITGESIIVNTSFNVRGEPIVCSSEDAVRCFLLTEIDDLLLDDHYIMREQQTRRMPTPDDIMRNLEQYGLD